MNVLKESPISCTYWIEIDKIKIQCLTSNWIQSCISQSRLLGYVVVTKQALRACFSLVVHSHCRLVGSSALHSLHSTTQADIASAVWTIAGDCGRREKENVMLCELTLKVFKGKWKLTSHICLAKASRMAFHNFKGTKRVPFCPAWELEILGGQH